VGFHGWLLFYSPLYLWEEKGGMDQRFRSVWLLPWQEEIVPQGNMKNPFFKSLLGLGKNSQSNVCLCEISFALRLNFVFFL
jgi:hypothetical protein